MKIIKKTRFNDHFKTIVGSSIALTIETPNIFKTEIGFYRQRKSEETEWKQLIVKIFNTFSRNFETNMLKITRERETFQL